MILIVVKSPPIVYITSQTAVRNQRFVSGKDFHGFVYSYTGIQRSR